MDRHTLGKLRDLSYLNWCMIVCFFQDKEAQKDLEALLLTLKLWYYALFNSSRRDKTAKLKWECIVTGNCGWIPAKSVGKLSLTLVGLDCGNYDMKTMHSFLIIYNLVLKFNFRLLTLWVWFSEHEVRCWQWIYWMLECKMHKSHSLKD